MQDSQLLQTIERFHAKWNRFGALTLNHWRRSRRLRCTLPGRRRSTRGLFRRDGLGRGSGLSGIGWGARGGRRGVVTGFDRIVLNLLFHRSQLGNVLLMLLVGVAESMAAGTVRDEEQIAGARRIRGSFQRGASRIGDRPRRE